MTISPARSRADHTRLRPLATTLLPRLRRRTLGVIALTGAAAALAASASPAMATTANCANPATLAGSAFEIDTDANLIVNTTGCIDWLSGGTGTGFRSGVLMQPDATGQTDDSFGQGTAEDNANPTITTGSIPPNKSDLKAFGVYTEDIAGTTQDFLQLFWSRVQNPSGTTNMDFELNKVFCDGTAANCANNGTKTPVYVTPKRSTGDKLITYDLSKGGTVPTISIRTWTSAGAWSAATVISGGANADALGSVNTSSIPANQAGTLGSQDPFTFGEASISFKALFGTETCGTFGSAYLKSRSSDSFTAEIKDFVPPEKVNISNCPSGISTTAVTNVQVGQPISDTAHLNVAAGAGGTITFHLYSDAGCLTQVFTDTVSVSGPGDYTSGSYTPSLPGSYFWTADYSGDATTDGSSTACGDAGETSVVNKIPSGISTHQSVIPNDSATVTGGGTGSVRFRLYSGATCDGNALLDQTRTLSGGSASTNNTAVSVDTDGTYSWLVEYPGDDTHTGATSSCSTEHFVVNFTNG